MWVVKLCCRVLLCLYVLPGRSQSGDTGLAERCLSDAGLLTLSGDVFTASLHPAGAAAVERFTVGLQAEKFAWTGSPMHVRTAAVMPTSSGHFSALMRFTVHDGYRSFSTGIGYARPLSGWCNLGVRLNYVRRAILGYGSVSTFPVDFGIVFRLYNKLWSDVACWNLLGAKLKYREPYSMPRLIRSGLTYQVSDMAGISVSALAEEGRELACQVSLFYRFHRQLSSQMVYTTANHGLTLFASYETNGLRVGFGFSYAFPIGALGVPGLQYATVNSKDP
jgi:hypothetical protein